MRNQIARTLSKVIHISVDLYIDLQIVRLVISAIVFIGNLFLDSDS